MRLEVKISFYQDIREDEIEMFRVVKQHKWIELENSYKDGLKQILIDEFESKGIEIDINLAEGETKR